MTLPPAHHHRSPRPRGGASGTGELRDAVAAGARLLAGGTANGQCFAPTVLADVAPGMRAYREESFGPVVTVITVEGPDEALRVANDNDYGLTSAVFTRDLPLALDLAKRLNAGMCHINGTTLDDEPQIPFGGMKDSGYGNPADGPDWRKSPNSSGSPSKARRPRATPSANERECSPVLPAADGLLLADALGALGHDVAGRGGHGVLLSSHGLPDRTHLAGLRGARGVPSSLLPVRLPTGARPMPSDPAPRRVWEARGLTGRTVIVIAWAVSVR
ncbi:aldehyde dehydrogenase family protein [Kitasatospora aureofaciens]|uniref:aldehyde dehydrogenase family protein n=1 Tax=Kitasatospora aureofaciens TaxID=1894 RepID=UPI001E168793|nr:aldehyde dehydrogenase family protein [Kitasatospora aureofaciens]HJD81165.1 aldehyde dehydrogenase family protein [Kitasatospora aureofaciens]